MHFYPLYQHTYTKLVGKKKRVTVGRQVPAVLVELGFLSNPTDARELDPNNPEGSERRRHTLRGIHLGTDESF